MKDWRDASRTAVVLSKSLRPGCGPSGQSYRAALRSPSPIDYMLKRWEGFTSFLGDGRICLTNNAAERALRGFALGRKSWLFAGSDRGSDRAAFMATMIMTRQAQRCRSAGMAWRCPNAVH